MKVAVALKKACQMLRHRVRYKDASLTLPDSVSFDIANDTEAIQQATKVYVESWIVPIIDLIECGDLHALAHICSDSLDSDKMEKKRD